MVGRGYGGGDVYCIGNSPLVKDGGGGGMAVVEMPGVTFCLHSIKTWDGVLWLTGCNMHCDMYDACTLPSGYIPLTLLLGERDVAQR